jgi:hypothetical protein
MQVDYHLSLEIFTGICTDLALILLTPRQSIFATPKIIDEYGAAIKIACSSRVSVCVALFGGMAEIGPSETISVNVS